MQALAFGLVAALAWGVHDILVRYVSRAFGVIDSLFFVLLFGAFVWLGIGFAFGDLRDIEASGIGLAMLAGFCYACAYIGHYNAFAKGPVRIVAPIIGTFAVLAFVIAAIMGKEITALQWAAVCALVLGIALVANRADEEADGQAQEKPQCSFAMLMGFCIAAVFGFGFTFALGQAVSAEHDPFSGVLVTRVTATACIALVYGYLRAKGKRTAVRFSMNQWLLLLLIGALDAIALGAVLAAGIYPNAEYASAASSVFGLITVLIAWIVLKEMINRIQWSGIIVTFASIAFLAAQ